MPRRHLERKMAPRMPAMVMKNVTIPAAIMMAAPEKYRDPVKKSRLEPVWTR